MLTAQFDSYTFWCDLHTNFKLIGPAYWFLIKFSSHFLINLFVSTACILTLSFTAIFNNIIFMRLSCSSITDNRQMPREYLSCCGRVLLPSIEWMHFSMKLSWKLLQANSDDFCIKCSVYCDRNTSLFLPNWLRSI